MTWGLSALAAGLQGPLVWMPCTLAVYAASTSIQRRCGNAAILNPTLLTIGAIGSLLVASGTPYEVYLKGVDFLNYVLGTAVVALALPLHRHAHLLRGRFLVLAMALVVGSIASLGLVLAVAGSLGASTSTLLSIASKSATAAVSIETSRAVGGLPGLTATLTISTGIIGAVLGPYVLDWLGVRDPEARGLALGVAAHGIGTARAFSEGAVSGSFASVGTALNAPLTAMLVPLAVWALGLC